MTPMTDEMQSIADRVRGVAAQKRFSQEQVASILGLSRQAVSNRYTAKVAFQAWEIGRLSQRFDVPVGDFYTVDRAERAA